MRYKLDQHNSYQNRQHLLLYRFWHFEIDFPQTIHMSHTYMYILYHPLFKTFIQNYHFHYICISYSKQKDSLQNGRCHVEDPGQLYYYYILFPY